MKPSFGTEHLNSGNHWYIGFCSGVRFVPLLKKNFQCQRSHVATWIFGQYRPFILPLLSRILFQAQCICSSMASSGAAEPSLSVQCFIGKLYGKINTARGSKFFTRRQIWVKDAAWALFSHCFHVPELLDLSSYILRCLHVYPRETKMHIVLQQKKNL